MEAGIHLSTVLSKKEIKSKNIRLLKKIFKYSMVLVESNREDVKIVTKLKKKCRRINDHYLRSADFSEFLRHLRRKIKRDTQNTFVYLKELNDEVKLHSVPSNLISGYKCKSTTPVVTISDDSDSHDVPNNTYTKSLNQAAKKILTRKKVDLFAESVILPKNVKPFHFPIVLLEKIEKLPTKSQLNSKQLSRSKRGKPVKNIQKRRILKRHSKNSKKFHSSVDNRTHFNLEQPLTSRRSNKSVETAEVISCVQKILEENNKSYYPIALIEDIKAHFNLGRPSSRQSKVSFETSEGGNDTYIQKQQITKKDQNCEKFNFPIVKLVDCNTTFNLGQETNVPVKTHRIMNGNHVEKSQNCKPFNSSIALSENTKTHFNLIQHSKSRLSNISVETIAGKNNSKDCKLVNSPVVLIDNISDLEHPSVLKKSNNNFIETSTVKNDICVPKIRVSKRNSKDCELVNTPTDLKDSIKTVLNWEQPSETICVKKTRASIRNSKDNSPILLENNKINFNVEPPSTISNTNFVATSDVGSICVKKTRASIRNSKDNSFVLLEDNKTHLNVESPSKSRKLNMLIETTDSGNVCIKKTKVSKRYSKDCNSPIPQDNSTHLNLEKSSKSIQDAAISELGNISDQQRRVSQRNSKNYKPDNSPVILLQEKKLNPLAENVKSQVLERNLKDCQLLNSPIVETNFNLRRSSTSRSCNVSAKTSEVKQNTPSKKNSDSTFNFPITILEGIKTHFNLEEFSPSKQLNVSVESTNDKNDTCVQKRRVSKRNSNDFNSLNAPISALGDVRTRSNSKPGLTLRQSDVKMSIVRKKSGVKKRRVSNI